jgi:hypothetical protein
MKALMRTDLFFLASVMRAIELTVLDSGLDV